MLIALFLLLAILGSLCWFTFVPLAELYLSWYRRKHNITVRK